MKIDFGRGRKPFLAAFIFCLAIAALVTSLWVPGLFQGNLRRGKARRPASVVPSGAALSVQAPPAPNTGASSGLVILPGPPSAAKPSLLMTTAKPPAPNPPPQLSKPRTSTAQVPINFQPNRGQAAGDVRFIARAPGYDIHLQDRALTFNLFSSPALPASLSTEQVSAARETSVSLELLGATEHPQLSAMGELPGKANYLRSSDPATWITGVPTYAGVLYRDVYRGIDVVFHGAGNRLEYDFTVAPGADASQIAWRFDTSAVTLAGSGDLVLEAGGAELRFLKPVIYQSDQHGRQYVTGSYHLQSTDGGAMVRFDLGEYDHSRALIIDPVLSYSTAITAAYGYIGSMTTDSAGNAYLTSASGILQITKLATDGATMLYQTSIGSGYSASATGAAVDNAGNLYLTGTTGTGFPTTSTAYQPVSGSGSHAYLTVLDPTGSTLVYSTYLQGSYIDSAVAIALDNSGAHPLPVIAGFTYSTDFPNTSSVILTGSQTAFVAKLDPTLSGAASLLYSTVVPAIYSSLTQGLAADGSGNIYALLQAQTLTTTPGAFTYDGIYVGYGGVYVVKLNAAGVSQYVAYLGYGNAADIAADSSGNAYVVGDPLYADFPATTGAYQTTFPFGFLSVLNPTGSALVYSTFLSGPSGNVSPTSVAIPAGCASACNVYVGGFTTANDFPVTASAIQKTLGGASDAFIVQVSGDGASAPFSSYLGGTYDENIDASYYYYYYYYIQRLPKVSLDGGATPNIFIAGNTNSPDFPLSAPGTTGGFLTKISPANLAIVIPDQYKINFPTQTINVASAPITVHLRNYGSATVSLTGLTATPGFAQTNSCGGSIAGGSSCALQVTYTPSYPGPVSGSLTVNHGGTNNPTVIALSGSGANQPLASVSPAALHFGTQAVNTSSATQVVTVTSTGTLPVTISNITTYAGDPEFALTHNCPASLQPGASCSVAVTFSPLTVGYFSSTLYVQTNSANTNYFYVSLDGSASAGTGVGPSGLTPSTTALNFLDQAVGAASGTQYVYVYNTGTVPVTFGTPSIAGANPADFSLSYNSCPLYAVVPSSSCTIGLIFKPTATGARSGTLTLPNSTGAPVAISLAGNGVTAVGSLLFSPAAMVFPDSAVGSTSTTQQITVTNQGTTSVTIDRVFDSGNDFRVSYTNCIAVLAPNGSACYIDVAFTPTAIGPITGTVTLVDNAPGSPQTIALSGNGVTAVETLVVSPSSVGFVDTVLGSSTYTPVYLYNPGNRDITISSLITSLPDFTVSGCTNVPAFSYCIIYVTFKPTIVGPRSDTLTITDTAPGSPQSVPLLGNGLAGANSLEVSPLIVGFPDTVLGVASSQQAVTLYNPGNTNVNVSSPPTASGDFSVTNSCGTIYAGSYCTVYVTFTPTQAGQRTGTLSIMDDAPNSPHTATLVGNGVNAFLEVIATPASLGFLDQVVGTTSTYSTIYFFNPGNTNVGVTNVSISGDFAIYSNGCPTQIPAQSYCAEYVTFSPTGSGPRTGTLTMTDTAAGSPHGVSLYGNGLAASASLTLTPTSMDFGNVLAGVASPAQALYLTNTGTQPVVVTSVTPSNFFQGSGCVGTINAGTQCGISVTYTGSGTVAQVGNITVLDSSTGIAHAVQLTGTPVSPAPAVSISPNGLTFVQTVVGKTSSALSTTFVNHSGATVTVTSVLPSPGDFALNSNNCSSVPNNGSCAVSVNFTPTASGVRTATLTFTYGTGSTITINLTGYAQPATTELVLTPSALSFPDQVVGSTSSVQLVYLWNQGTVPVSVSGNISISPADFAISSTSCNGANIQPASYCYAYVSFQPASATTINGALTINTVSDPASPHVVTLTGNGVSPVKNLAFSANSMQFPDQPVGFPSTAQYFYLYNSGNTNVTLPASKPATGDFAVTSDACGATVYAHSTCYLYITFTPTQTGPRSGSLTLADDATGNPHSIALSGNGITPTKALTLSGTAMAFGDQPVGTTSTYQSLTAYNTGAAPVTFTASTINGDFSLQYGTCQSGSVPPKSYCTLYVVFQPSATGTRTGSLTIHSSAGSSPVSLTGTGVAVVHAARVGSTAISFPDQAVGITSAYQYLYLYNTGNVPLNVSSINLSGDFANPYAYTCNGPIAVNSYCYIYLTFTPTVTGPRTGTLTIADDSAAGTHTVALSGNGVTPTRTLTLIPGNLQFLPQVIGVTSSYLYVAVTSTGNAPITITGANVTDTIAGSGFALYSNGCSTLPAFGNQCYVYVTVTPTISGPLAGTLSITDTATGSPHTIALAGTGVASNQAVQLSQSSLTFGNQAIGTTSPVQYVYLVNQSATAVNITNFVVSGDYQVTGCGIGNYIYSSSSCVFNVYFKPTAAGARPGSITITDTGAGSPRTITLNGTGVNPFPIASLSTNNLVFASQSIGSNSALQAFTLTNTGTAPLNIAGIAFSPATADYALTPAGSCGATLAVNGACAIYVTFTPSAGSPGTRSATLVFTDNDSSGTQSVNITGNALASSPLVALSPIALSFGNQAVNVTSTPPQTVTLTNQGNAALNITNVAASSQFAVATNNCPAPLNALANCAITVTFTPTAGGPQSGTLTITDSAAGSPHIVGLTGTGVGSPSISVNPASLIFSNQQVGVASNAQAIVVSNSGSAMLISSIGISAGDFAQTSNCPIQPSTLNTNGSCSINVTFTPTAVGTRTATITINDNSGAGQQNVPVSGTGIGLPAVTLSPVTSGASPLTFANQNVGTSSTSQAVTLTNNGGGPLAISSIQPSAGYAQSNNCGNNLDAGANCTINVSFVPTIIGTQGGSISIADNAAGSPHSISTSGVGLGAQPAFAPTSLNFGSVAVGTPTSSPAVTLTNTGNVDMNITGFQINNPPYSQTNNCPATLAANASCTITVVFNPTAAATQNGTLYVLTNGINGGTAALGLTGVGFGPVAGVSPASLSFGSVTVGTASPAQPITLSSTGSTALNISNITFSGSGDYSQTNTCPATLTTGSNCTISVAFTPGSVGTRSGTLLVYDNTAASPHQVALSGIGLGPAITFNPPSLNFGTINLGTTSSSLPLSLTNSGTNALQISSITASSEFAQTNNCPSSLAASLSCTISVTFTPAAPGTRNGSITVLSNAGTQSAALTGVGTGPQVQLAPPSLSFGSLPIGLTSAPQPVVFTNSGNAALTITSIVPSTDFAESDNCPASLGAGSFCTINVTFKPSVIASENGAITITDSAGGSPHHVTLSGTGTGAQTDLAVTGTVIPATIPPGGSFTYTFVVTNSGPSPATGVAINITLPLAANATLNSVNTTAGACTGTGPLACSIGNLASGSAATVTIAMTATAVASFPATGTASGNETDPSNTNNSLTLTSAVLAADLAVVGASAPTTSGGTPAYVMMVTNNGPSSATNVSMTCAYNRYQYIAYSTPYGTCTYSNSSLTCSLGTIAVGASTGVTQQVQPPNSGWASIDCTASATERDPNPVNNFAQISPPLDSFNTTTGNNVAVQLADVPSGTLARVTFSKVTQPGTSSLTRTDGATAPAGFRTGAQPTTFDLSTSALYNAPVTESFGFSPAQFHKPAQVHLFHMEGGAWVDRTVAMDLSTFTVSAMTSSLSPFALFEPLNHPPTANAGVDRTVSGASVVGASVALDGSFSSDPDSDSLTYRWTGPFPEGNGVATGAKPSVTLPFGTSKVTLVVNDGEADSAPVAVNVAISDFALALTQGSISLKRGQSTTLNLNITSKGGSFDQPVTLGCANLPASMTCQFSPPSVQPGVAGANTVLTLASSGLAQGRRSPRPLWAMWTGLFGVLGIVLAGARRGRGWTLLLIVLVLTAIFYTGCGGGGMTSAPQNTTPSTTVVITVTGSSGGLQHSTTANITVN